MANKKTLLEILRPVVSIAVEHTPAEIVEEYLVSLVRDNPESFLEYIDYSDLVEYTLSGAAERIVPLDLDLRDEDGNSLRRNESVLTGRPPVIIKDPEK